MGLALQTERVDATQNKLIESGELHTNIISNAYTPAQNEPEYLWRRHIVRNCDIRDMNMPMDHRSSDVFDHALIGKWPYIYNPQRF